MSVLVTGMAMPSECEYCGFCRYYRENGNVWCNAKNKLLKERWINPDWTHLDVKKPEWCPLVEVPVPHGVLIDRDALKNAVYRHLCIKGEENLLPAEKSVFGNIIKAPAIIEAEVET